MKMAKDFQPKLTALYCNNYGCDMALGFPASQAVDRCCPKCGDAAYNSPRDGGA